MTVWSSALGGVIPLRANHLLILQKVLYIVKNNLSAALL